MWPPSKQTVSKVWSEKWASENTRRSTIGSGRIDAAGYFKSAPVAAPIAAAAIAVPLGQAFPFLAIGANCLALVDELLGTARGDAMDDRYYLRGGAFRAWRNAFGGLGLSLFCGHIGFALDRRNHRGSATRNVRVFIQVESTKSGSRLSRKKQSLGLGLVSESFVKVALLNSFLSL
jgi:hypothetical protein